MFECTRGPWTPHCDWHDLPGIFLADPEPAVTHFHSDGNFSGINRIWLVCSMLHPIQYFMDFETNEQLRTGLQSSLMK
jgi:hypothetical protein